MLQSINLETERDTLINCYGHATQQKSGCATERFALVSRLQMFVLDAVCSAIDCGEKNLLFPS